MAVLHDLPRVLVTASLANPVPAGLNAREGLGGRRRLQRKIPKAGSSLKLAILLNRTDDRSYDAERTTNLAA
ncbi:hypothetical protein PtA15_6A236 [Puccinia triticina]|uniref:Uncharacterized protein n=1 Tax=Puccinia triticina TaxID=208348 RepID=A0ABY7CL10_9BASI|nr:uncharacterized protein PtA15_6A236 [Puccinia triticina]WAQ85608.1 hypothetical protein PtA15_6A236 [Puccinia triticina]